METRKNKVIVSGLCIVGSLVIAGIMAQSGKPASIGTYQGTGECGYYQNVGTLHRNGLVTPDHCAAGEAYSPVIAPAPFFLTIATITSDHAFVSEDKPDKVLQPADKRVKILEPVTEKRHKRMEDKKDKPVKEVIKATK